MYRARGIALIVIGFLFSAVAVFAAPAVTVSPKVGPPTAKTTVSGTGFGASKLIDVYFDTTNLCLAISNGAGAFSCEIRVPASALPQTHWVTAVQRNTGDGAQKPFLVRTDWAQFHGRNATHKGHNPFENTLNVGNVADLEVLWSAKVGSQGTSGSVTVAAGKVYVGGNDAKLYAFNAETGATIAGFPVTIGGALVSSTPAVGGGRVFVGANAQLHAFNAKTGAPVGAPFPIALGSTPQSSPALALGNVYIGVNNGTVHAYNAKTGAAVSGFPVTLRPGGVLSGPTIADGRAYAGLFQNDGGTTFFAFDALTGAPAAGFPKSIGRIVSTAAVSNGAVFVGTHNNNLEAFSLATGASLPGFPVSTGGDIDSSPAVAGGRVFVGALDNKIYAYSVAGGAPIWSTLLDNVVQTSPVVANGVVYVSTVARLYGLNQSTGAILFTANVGNGNFQGAHAPVVANGILYFASESPDGNLYAFSINGEPVSARLPGGALGVKPALSSLRFDPRLRPVRTPVRIPTIADSDSD